MGWHKRLTRLASWRHAYPPLDLDTIAQNPTASAHPRTDSLPWYRAWQPPLPALHSANPAKRPL